MISWISEIFCNVKSISNCINIARRVRGRRKFETTEKEMKGKEGDKVNLKTGNRTFCVSVFLINSILQQKQLH